MQVREMIQHWFNHNQMKRTRKFLELMASQGLSIDEMNLCGLDLSGLKLRGVTLRNCDFKDSNLNSIDLEDAHLEGVHFEHASLQGADLKHCHFKDVDLSHANLRFAILLDTEFENVSFDHTIANEQTVFPFSRKEAKAKGIQILKDPLLFSTGGY